MKYFKNQEVTFRCAIQNTEKGNAIYIQNQSLFCSLMFLVLLINYVVSLWKYI